MTIKKTADNNTYVVKYMHSVGRTCIARIMLQLAGANHTSVFVTEAQVAADRAATPFGKVPVLTVTHPDGSSFELAESIAIEHYLAERLGFLSSDVDEAARMKSVALNVYFELYNHCFAGKIPINEAIADPTSEFNTKALPDFIAAHERWLTKNGSNGHYFGDQLTYPDIALCNWIRIMAGLGVQIKEDSPIKKLEQTVKAYKGWNGQYDVLHPFGVLSDTGFSAKTHSSRSETGMPSTNTTTTITTTNDTAGASNTDFVMRCRCGDLVEKTTKICTRIQGELAK
ncbi:hypothetical protein BG004_008051, partial [Podila humilis]